MTRRRPLRVDRMRRYPIRRGPQHRVLRWEEWTDQPYLDRLLSRIAAAYPTQRLDFTAEQSGPDFIEGRFIVRWRAR
jgi:hypothetical protein